MATLSNLNYHRVRESLTGASTNIIGDLNNSWSADKADAGILIKYLNKETTLTNEQILKADFNSDNKITKKDYCALLSSVDHEIFLKECSDYGYK